MPNRKKLLLLFLIFLVKTGVSQIYPIGNLVIVGGGLEYDNKSVFNQLIELSGGPEKAIFSVIPSASGVATQAYVYFSKELISYGVKPENIHLIPIAMADDDSTKDVDESTWKNNGNDLMLAEMVRKSTCVWFSGGDQVRTMKTLIRPDGTKTPVLEAVWDVFKSGGVVGGTSAGAAIMSEPMIGAGSTMGALKHGVITDYKGDDFLDGDGVFLTHGLGFFPVGMVDQHFNTRARLARFILAMMHDQKIVNIGFGVDENTALIYNGKQKILKVAGTAGITIVNTSKAIISYPHNLPHVENVMISYLEDGDVYDFATRTIIPADGKKSMSGNEKNNIENPVQSGMFSGSPSNFLSMITTDLIDNKAADKVQNITFTGMQSGFLVTMAKTNESKGYSVKRPGESKSYTVTGIRMDIEPVEIKLAPVK